jgi:hypothetical protein
VKDAFERNEKKDSMLREKDTQIKMLLEQISQQTAQINKLLSMISAPKPYFSAAAEPIADYK